jgi:hypothetical protein
MQMFPLALTVAGLIVLRREETALRMAGMINLRLEETEMRVTLGAIVLRQEVMVLRVADTMALWQEGMVLRGETIAPMKSTLPEAIKTRPMILRQEQVVLGAGKTMEGTVILVEPNLPKLIMTDDTEVVPMGEDQSS